MLLLFYYFILLISLNNQRNGAILFKENFNVLFLKKYIHFYVIKKILRKSHTYTYTNIHRAYIHSYNKISKLFFSLEVNSVYFSCSKIRTICIFEILSDAKEKEKKIFPFQFLVTSNFFLFFYFLNFILPSWCVFNFREELLFLFNMSLYFLFLLGCFLEKKYFFYLNKLKIRCWRNVYTVS